MAFHYENDDLDPETATGVIVDAFQAAQTSGELDLSDLVDALRSEGATYVSTGRAFVLIQDHLRGYLGHANRGTTQLQSIGDLIPESIVCRQLNTTLRNQYRKEGTEFIDEDPNNWIDDYVYRFGDYKED